MEAKQKANQQTRTQHDFEFVEKADRKTPLQERSATRCPHERVWTSEKYPAHGTRYICADCGFGSGWLRDLATDE